MSLTPPKAGLRRLFNDSKQVAKITVVVEAGAELVVPDDLAEQLLIGYGNHFREGAAPAAPKAKPEASEDYDDAKPKAATKKAAAKS